MKRTDFSFSGGFPLTQDRLNDMQNAYAECLDALGRVTGAAATSGVILSGCGLHITGSVYGIAAGYIYCTDSSGNGQVVRVPGQTGVTITGGNVPYLSIDDHATSLTYNDGGVHASVIDRYATLVPAATGTSVPGILLEMSMMVPYGTALGLNYREQTWQTLVVNTPAGEGGVTGNVYYKKDTISNTLQIKCDLMGAANAQNFPANTDSIWVLMGTLSSAYCPADTVFFTAHVITVLSSLISLDHTNVEYIRTVECLVQSNGNLFMRWIQPDTSIAGYTVRFNSIVPLD